jgi:glycosyltransferase involved in cell wall biosynthesis
MQRPPHAFVGLYAGRLEPQKRVDIFLRACADVMGRRDLFVWICGDGSERGRLQTLARELGIEKRVHFTGFTSDIWRYLRASDFSALLSDYEGEPNALLEAFAAGVPAILSDTEAHRPFRAQAQLVPHNDAPATARGIEVIFDDPVSTRERVAAAHRLAASRNIDAHVAAYTAVYETRRSGGLHVAIDGSNLRSGGPITHITEVLRHATPSAHGIRRVTIWGGKVTLARMPKLPWLECVHVRQLDLPLPFRVAWQLFRRPRLTRHCDVLFAPGVTPARGFEPFVSVSQNMQPFDGRERARYPFSFAAMRLWMLRYLQARAFRQSAAVIFLTEFARDWIGAIAGSGVVARSTVVAHGVSDTFRQPPRLARPLASHTNDDPFRIVYVSDFYIYKHQWTIAEAVCRLREEGLPVTLELIGAPVEAAAVRRLQKTLERHAVADEAVRVVSTIPHDALPDVYRGAGAFVFASTCENLPLTLVEAMASGLPIATAAERPMTDILGDRAVYFDPEDPASATDALRALAVDHALRERIAAANCEASLAYSWRRCADETFALLARVARPRIGVTTERPRLRLVTPRRPQRQAQG